MRRRSFGVDPSIVARHGAIFADTLSKARIACSMKHFPGHGSSANDSHLGFVDVTDSWQPSELEPYRQMLKQPQPLPDDHDGACLSASFRSCSSCLLIAIVVEKMLRKDLGFQGVVVADDLQMRAISQHFGFEEAILKALRAGNVILISATISTLTIQTLPPRLTEPFCIL